MRWLWPVPVVLFVVYPYLKRVTWLCHLWLGASLGLAPVGAWLAVTGSAPWEAWALAAAVGLLGGGVRHVLRAVRPRARRRKGCTRGRRAGGTAVSSRGRGVFHLAAVALLAAAGAGLGAGVWYWLGVAAVAALLALRAPPVRPGDLRRLDAAFFTVNGVISIVFFAFVAAGQPVSPPLLIRARDVEKRYGPGVRSARGVVRARASGGCLLVTGPNGSGKTTLLRLALRAGGADARGTLEVGAASARSSATSGTSRWSTAT